MGLTWEVVQVTTLPNRSRVGTFVIKSENCKNRLNFLLFAMQDIQNQKSYQYLLEVETLAQDILTDRETKLDLSNAKNKFREAFRALQSVDDRRTWMQMGSVYIERPTEECKAILQAEIANADNDIAELENTIKSKVHKLRDLEHEPKLEGFTLKPISAAEAKALNKAFRTI